MKFHKSDIWITIKYLFDEYKDKYMKLISNEDEDGDKDSDDNQG